GTLIRRLKGNDRGRKGRDGNIVEYRTSIEVGARCACKLKFVLAAAGDKDLMILPTHVRPRITWLVRKGKLSNNSASPVQGQSLGSQFFFERTSWISRQ